MAISEYTLRPELDPFRDGSLGTPTIVVVNPVTGEAKCTVDRFYSFIWTERYREAGEFELEGPIDEFWAGQVEEGDYIFFSHSGYSYAFGGASLTAMVVESRYTKTDAEKGKSVFCNGRTLESLLDRRVNFGCRYGTMRSLKDGYLISNPTSGGNAGYGLAITDCSYKGRLYNSSDGYRPDWYDHHAPLRTYELVPEVVAGVNPYYFYEYIALVAVACNCGPLARTNRQFEYFTVQGTPYDARSHPAVYDPFRFKTLVKGLQRDKYTADGWYDAIDRSKEAMADDTDVKLVEATLPYIQSDQQYEETRFDWQDFANYPEPISEQWFKDNYSQEFYDSLHICHDPYSGIGDTVYDIVTHCLDKCDGLDGGWGMKLTASAQTGKSDGWFTDPGIANANDADPTKKNRPHDNGHVKLRFELYKGRDLTINGPHANDGQAVLFSEQNDNVKYIDYLHGEADFKNVLFRTTGLEYVVEKVWALNLAIDLCQRRIYAAENFQNVSDDERFKNDLDSFRAQLEDLKSQREKILDSMSKLGLSQQYFSAEVRDRNGKTKASVHYPSGVQRREMISTEGTKADTFIESDQLQPGGGDRIEGPQANLDYGRIVDSMAGESGVTGNMAVSMDYQGRATQTMNAYYKEEEGDPKKPDEPWKDYWYMKTFSPNWSKYAAQLTESNTNTIKLKANSKTRDIETEVDINAFQIAGRDYYVGDLVTLAMGVSAYKDVQPGKDTVKTMRCDEIVYSIDGSGFTAIPTFKILEDPDAETDMEGA